MKAGKILNSILGRNNWFICVVISIVMSSTLPLYGQNHNVENSDAYKNGNIYQKDFLVFIDMLKETHPSFAPNLQPLFNIDSVQQEGAKWSSKCQSVEELSVYLQSILTLLNDGHTGVDLNRDLNIVYPFSFFKDNQTIYLGGVNKEYESSLGKEISQINAYPVLDVINSFRQMLSTDNDVRFFVQVNNYMPFYSMWKNNPYCSVDSLLKLTFTDATTISISPISKKKMNISRQQSKAQPNSMRKSSRSPFLYTILPEKNICYLQFNKCQDQTTVRSYYSRMGMSKEEIEKRVSKIPIFDIFLNEMFQAIAINKISTLVIDVRDNSGGDSQLCNDLLARLKARNQMKSGTASIRHSKLWEQSYSQLAAEWKQKFAEKGEVFERGRLYDNELLYRVLYSSSSSDKEKAVMSKKSDSIKSDEENRYFKGNVVFIQNTRTYSSAGMLITSAVDNNIGIVIGDESSYSPNHYGDVLKWELPNTKINGFISHKIFYRSDISKCNERSLIPTVELTPSYSDIFLEGKDIYWEWILEHYTK